MTAPLATWDKYRAPLQVRKALQVILGPSTCTTCMEPKDSPLHRELCTVAIGGGG